MESAPDNLSSSGSRVPARRLKAFSVFLLFFALFCIVTAAAFLGYSSGNIHQAVEIALRGYIGRDVRVGKMHLSYPVRIETLVVPGPDYSPEEPTMTGQNLSAYPRLKDLLFHARFTFSRVVLEHARVTIQYSSKHGWSTRGLFPKPAGPEPAVRRIELPALELVIKKDTAASVRHLSGTLSFGPYGDFDFTGKGPGLAVEVKRRRSNERARFAVGLDVDTLPFTSGLPLSGNLDLEPASGRYSGRLFSKLRGLPAGVSFEIKKHGAGYFLDSGTWTLGEYTGPLQAALPGSADRRFVLSTRRVGPLSASTFDGRFQEGSLTIETAVLTGRWRGKMTLTAAARVSALSADTPLYLRNVSGNVRARITIDSTFRRRIEQFEAEGTFRSYRSRRIAARDGRIRVHSRPGELFLSGRAKLLGGSVVVRKARMGMFGLKPRTLDADFHADSISLDAFGWTFRGITPRHATGDFQIRAHATPAGWKPERVFGRCRRLAVEWNGDPVTTTQTVIETKMHPALSGRLSGRATLEGFHGDVTLEIKNGRLEKTEISAETIAIAALRRHFRIPILDTAARYLSTFGAKGSLIFNLPSPDSPLRRDYCRFEGRAWTSRFRPFPRKRRPLLPSDTLVIPFGVTAQVLAPLRGGLTYVRNCTLFVPGKKGTVGVSDFVYPSEDLALQLALRGIPGRTAMEFLNAYKPDLHLDRLDVSGILSGPVYYTAKPVPAFEVTLSGDAFLKKTPFHFNLEGRISQRDPSLLLFVDEFSPQALYESLADINPVIKLNLVRFLGTAAARVTVVGDTWADLNIEGTIEPKKTSLYFRNLPIRVEGITGAIPFRLRRAEKLTYLEVAPDRSRRIHVDTVAYDKLHINDLDATSRFDVKTISVEDAHFSFASGTGKGAFAITFPTWDHPRVAFFGSADSVDFGIVYRKMQPFKGVLEGKGSLRGELKLDGTVLNVLNVDVTMESGVLGSELLKVFVQDMKPVTTLKTLARDALLELTEWNFDSAVFRVKYNPLYYSPGVALRKFGDRSIRGEFLADYTIVGKVAPLAKFYLFSKKIRPFRDTRVLVTLKVVQAQMRLLLDRVGRHTR
ncbi:MAG: hypothetical protein D6679_07000 [Candidatus Hydrogenedentota bacterium]|nr:MAG: hypothetical protein D6679_07000 [Candidatus Hydrogenedentota bacterium]